MFNSHFILSSMSSRNQLPSSGGRSLSVSELPKPESSSLSFFGFLETVDEEAESGAPPPPAPPFPWSPPRADVSAESRSSLE